ncbi:tetratricopeptide repeat protein [Companilactobacillus sp. HBUAS59699]|uniref:tetratricopeptide repeat protein n=1 Tax=Companilactobacillus sp. HBUAS59699 TaxID=3109358 RepID=UPI002FF0053D
MDKKQIENEIKKLVKDLNTNDKQLSKVLKLSAYLVQVGDLEQAEELLLRSLTNFPNEKDLRYNLGNVYFMAAKYDKASNIFQKLIQDDYGFEAYFMQAKTLDEQGKKQLAIVYALTATEKNSEDIGGLELMADLLLSNGNFDEAMNYYKKANAIKPTAKYYFNMALCAMNLDQDYQPYLDKSKKLDEKYYLKNEKKLSNLQQFLTKTGDSDDRK